MAGNYFYGFHIHGNPVPKLLDFVKSVRDQVPRATWTDDSKLHVTLKFAGKTAPQDELAQLCGTIHPVLLKIKSLGTFNNRAGPRVLFACLEPAPMLAQWHAALGGDARTFTPHLTLAKLEDGGDAEPLFASIAQQYHATSFDACFIDELRLYQTEGSGKPYRIVSWHRLLG